MKDRPTISIIVPIYNVDKYLQRCIDSIVGQTYGNIEVILVDDGSTDSSGGIIDSYAVKDSRVKVIHKKNGGVSSARNAGLKIATGQYVMFVDSDDRIDERTCEICVDAMDGEDLISFSARLVNKDEEGGVVEGGVDGSPDRLVGNRQIIERYLEGENLRVWAHLFKLETLGGLRFDENMRIHEDALFAFQFLQKANTEVILNEPLYWYISRADSAMKNPLQTDIADIRSHYDEVVKYISSEYPDLELEALKRTMGTLFNLLTTAKQVKDQKELAKVRKEIYYTGGKLKQSQYRMSLNHRIKLFLSYCPLALFSFGLLFYRRLRRIA